jgi:acetyltransferase-like isoleucine patch superfamily enzyme
MLLNGNQAREKWPGLKIPHGSSIDSSAMVLNPERIKIGHHVRIDAFCVLSPNDGYIEIGNYVHIAVHCSLFGSGGVKIGNYSNVAAYSILQSASDDFYNSLIGPTVPKELTNVRKDPIIVDDHVILGMRTTILPGVHVKEGVGTGANTLLTKTTEYKWKMYVGVNKLLYPGEGFDRDDITIRDRAQTLEMTHPRSGILNPDDFTLSGWCKVHFYEPQQKYVVKIEPIGPESVSHGAINSMDEYGFVIFSYVGRPKGPWRWELQEQP